MSRVIDFSTSSNGIYIRNDEAGSFVLVPDDGLQEAINEISTKGQVIVESIILPIPEDERERVIDRLYKHLSTYMLQREADKTP